MAKSVPDMKILSLEDPSWNRESEFFIVVQIVKWLNISIIYANF